MKKYPTTTITFLSIMTGALFTSCSMGEVDEISSSHLTKETDHSAEWSSNKGKNNDLPNFLNDRGRRALSLSKSERKKLAFELLSGRESVQNYTAGVCYQAVAFVRFLLGDPILSSGTEVEHNYYNINESREWNGRSYFATGDVIVFSRRGREEWIPFHTAIATGNGCEIRGVNGHLLGTGWIPVNLRSVLAGTNSSGEVNYDGRVISVRILNPRIVRSDL
ncbi:hypothetical protein [Chryseobacterium potabilaquae]|uniref:Uncharacterized protein n=1 Tax=Chryseobacterium potabilaquae TaxID=2675057 RepID=A0A6N4XG52_9FLAO|nr:hypothetical protein [Chryseobacterium potabilaquae]CAA7197628.1 hypothetical protein CHRY9293_03701 [Chryseobacterium potabilaquae]